MSENESINDKFVNAAPEDVFASVDDFEDDEFEYDELETDDFEDNEFERDEFERDELGNEEPEYGTAAETQAAVQAKMPRNVGIKPAGPVRNEVKVHRKPIVRIDDQSEVISEEEYADENAGDKVTFESLGIMEKAMVIMAVCVVVLLIAAVGIFALYKSGMFSLSKKESDVNEIPYNQELIGAGSELYGIDVIGGQGIASAVELKKAAAKEADDAAEVAAEEENDSYVETDYAKDITIAFETVSVVKDLKIKLINQKTGKLIANVPFELKITAPDGSILSWNDTDMDGVIYHTDLAAGVYTVHLNELDKEKYADYSMPDDARTEVKAEVVYEKVEVADEILSAAEVNEAEEDTVREGAGDDNADNVEVADNTDNAENNEQSVAVISDTVAWVDSSSATVYTVLSDTSAIAVPFLLANLDYGRTYTARVADYSADPDTYSIGISSDSVEITEGTSRDVTMTLTGIEESSVNVSSADTGIATATQNGCVVTITGVSAGTTSITVSQSVAEGDTPVSPVTINVTVKAVTQCIDYSADPSKYSIGLSAENIEVFAGSSADVSLTLTGIDEGSVTVQSADINVAALNKNGSVITITGVTAGTTAVTVSQNVNEGDTPVSPKTINVTVKAKPSISLGSVSAGILEGKNGSVEVTLKELDAAGTAVTSSNESVATAVLGSDGSTLTVTGIAAGNADITLSSVSDQTVSATVNVTVYSSSEKLTAKVDGKNVQLYIAEADGSYREAVYSDYSADKTFYYSNVRYTGWQTIDGNTYYYNSEGKYVTGEQVIQGVRYNFDSTGAMILGSGTLGIDVSKWNGSIDWNRVKAAGVSYVIIRVGYRGSTQGGLIDDSNFKTNIEGALAAGLKVGVYFVTQAVNDTEAVYEASMVLERIAGYRISYPVFLDVETSKGRGDAIDVATRTSVCKTFCQTIQNAGYTAGIYANKSWLTSKIDTSQLEGYKIWVAQYYTKCTYSGSYVMWQYTKSGSIDGISGKVDLNESYLGY